MKRRQSVDSIRREFARSDRAQRKRAKRQLRRRNKKNPFD
jgi:hypothetical protein